MIKIIAELISLVTSFLAIFCVLDKPVALGIMAGSALFCLVEDIITRSKQKEKERWENDPALR